MRLRYKGVFMLLCIMAFYGLFALETQAAGPRDGEIVDGTLLVSGNKAEAHYSPLSRGSLMTSGSIEITNQYHNGVIFIYGQTYCFQLGGTVKAYIALDKLVGEDWIPVTYANSVEDNVYYTEIGFNYVVDKYAYYRVRGAHVVIKGNDSNSISLETYGLYIN